MIDFEEGFVSPQRAQRRSVACTCICLKQLVGDPEYIAHERGKVQAKLTRRTAIALSFVTLTALLVWACAPLQVRSYKASKTSKS